MTTPAQRAAVETAIRRAMLQRDEALERAERIAAAGHAKVRKAVQLGFDRGMSGRELADIVGVGVPRIYQIRDGRR